jgi:ATP-dependent Lhr-like helicase
LSAEALAILQFLRQRGASFFPDIARGTGVLKSTVEAGLWELVTAGVLTADGFDNLRSLIDPKRRSGQGNGKNSRPRHSTGRWSPLYAGEPVDRSQALESICRTLLRRYGVVFREIVARETIVPKWREVLMCLRRFEDRGEIRGGRFVGGFQGEQFALPLAVDSLRAQRGVSATVEIATVSAADPLNLAGIIAAGEKIPANSGRFVTFRDGVIVPSEESRTVLKATG